MRINEPRRPYGEYFKSEPLGALMNPIIDSKMSYEQAVLAGLRADCPQDIIDILRLINIKYYGLDGLTHQGQLVLDHRLVTDIKEIFRFARSIHYTIQCAIPISHPFLNWDDETSMLLGIYGNTSAFNYRTIAGSSTLSNHSKGQAIDINPKINPYIRGDFVQPKGAKYDPTIEGTLTGDHPLVQKFKELGWEWGGDWEDRKDFQHFQKVLE